jgi:hypothetical protein
VLQIDAAMRRMSSTAPVPPREPGESFRSYFVRVTPQWIAAHGSDDPALTTHLEALVEREFRRHPRLAENPGVVPQMRGSRTRESAQEAP